MATCACILWNVITCVLSLWLSKKIDDDNDDEHDVRMSKIKRLYNRLRDATYSCLRSLWYCGWLYIITSPPTHSVGGQTSNGRWRLSSSSVTLHGRPAGGFSRAGQAIMSCRLQSIAPRQHWTAGQYGYVPLVRLLTCVASLVDWCGCWS